MWHCLQQMPQQKSTGYEHFLSFQLSFQILCLKVVTKYVYPFPKRQILDSSKLKEFADDNCEFVKTEEKFSKRVENTAGKGEIALCEQFLLFPQCFRKTYTADT